MKFTIDREALLRSISHAQSIVERRNTIPILANVLLRAEENGLVEITATDMDIGIIEKVPAGVAQAGAVTVSAHTLFEIVRKLEDGAQIELGGASESGQIELRSGRSSLKLSTLPSEDFPTVSGLAGTADPDATFQRCAEVTYAKWSNQMQIVLRTLDNNAPVFD